MFSFKSIKSPSDLDTFPDWSCVVTIAATVAVTIAAGGVEAGGVTLLDHLEYQPIGAGDGGQVTNQRPGHSNLPQSQWRSSQHKRWSTSAHTLWLPR